MSENWYRGVVIVKNAGTDGVQMIKSTGKPYNKPGPAKSWVTITRKQYPHSWHGRYFTVQDTYIEKVTGWERVE